MGVPIHVGRREGWPAFRGWTHRWPLLVGPTPGAGGLGQAGACSLRAYAPPRVPVKWGECEVSCQLNGRTGSPTALQPRLLAGKCGVGSQRGTGSPSHPPHP